MRLTNQASPLFLLGGPVGRRGFLLSSGQGLDPLVLGKAPSALRQLHPTFVMSHKICELGSPRGKAPWANLNRDALQLPAPWRFGQEIVVLHLETIVNACRSPSRTSSIR
jgi:hypothetical protein